MPTRFLERIIAGSSERPLRRSGGRRCGIKPKPDPAGIEQARALSGPARPRVMVGDSEIDIATGRLPVRAPSAAPGACAVSQSCAPPARTVDHPREIPPIIAKESAAAQRDR
jgi:phosphoglycolate phosphatase-like HAD superfamily hydrolase